jgi:hypothetical protein
MRYIRLFDYRTITTGLVFFSAIGISNIRFGQFKELSDYWISDSGPQSTGLSDIILRL